jgi:hypothetical protein
MPIRVRSTSNERTTNRRKLRKVFDMLLASVWGTKGTPSRCGQSGLSKGDALVPEVYILTPSVRCELLSLRVFQISKDIFGGFVPVDRGLIPPDVEN